MIQYDLTKATLILPDNTVMEIIPKGKSFTYKEIQAYLNGGLIQPIQLKYWTKDKAYKTMNFLCDEEGAINGSLPNPKATELLRHILGPNAQELYGPIIFLPNKLFRI